MGCGSPTYSCGYKSHFLLPGISHTLGQQTFGRQEPSDNQETPQTFINPRVLHLQATNIANIQKPTSNTQNQHSASNGQGTCNNQRTYHNQQAQHNFSDQGAWYASNNQRIRHIQQPTTNI